jgi:hypothetical protein
MITDYKILKAVDYKFLEDSVNQHIANNWQPYGDFTVSSFSYCGQEFVEFYQPIVRMGYEKES